ncbi:MAG: COX15/CtaA family protein [Angustibacter sp.]
MLHTDRPQQGAYGVRAEPGYVWLDRPARAVAIANVIAQIGIVVTGGLVRLTGSGLGCPTWPQCVPGSYTPVVEQAEGVHKYIEFGNRMLTGVIGLIALATLVLVARSVRRGRRPRHLVLLGSVPFIGVAAQAVLGGLTVLAGLHPATVAAHFLLSAILICASTVVVVRLGAPDGPRTLVVRREVVWLTRVLLVLTGVVLVLGTVVTGSGPHSGDADQPARFGFDPRTVSWLHADAVLLWFGVVAAILVALRLTEAPAAVRRAAAVVLAIGLAQGAIGYVQYATGLPEVAVAAHMLGASVLVVAVTVFAMRLTPRATAGEPVTTRW